MVAYGRRLLTRGGRKYRPGSTVLLFSLPRIHLVDTSLTIRNGSINKLESRLAYENSMFQAPTGGKTSEVKGTPKI